MFIRGYEWNILHDLIGRKAKALIVPTPEDSVAEPVEIILQLSDTQGIIIDSACFRLHTPTEMIRDYPQMRIRVEDHLKKPEGCRILPISQTGEIIQHVEVVNEKFSSKGEMADYTRAIHLRLSGDKDITISRESFRSPSLKVSSERDWKKEISVPAGQSSVQILAL